MYPANNTRSKKVKPFFVINKPVSRKTSGAIQQIQTEHVFVDPTRRSYEYRKYQKPTNEDKTETKSPAFNNITIYS